VIIEDNQVITCINVFSSHVFGFFCIELIQKEFLVYGDFPGYPLRYPEPSFHYLRVPGLPASNEIKINSFFFKFLNLN